MLPSHLNNGNIADDARTYSLGERRANEEASQISLSNAAFVPSFVPRWLPHQGLEPGTCGLTVAIYGVNRCTNGPPSLVEARQGSPSSLRFPYVLGSDCGYRD